MQPETLIACAVATILAASVAFFIHRQRQTRALESESRANETAALHSDYQGQLASSKVEHSEAMSVRERQYYQEGLRLQRAHESRLAELNTSIARSRRLSTAAIRQAAVGMRWELASREALAAAMDVAGIDAVIATNIVFAPSESGTETFCAQIDHLVITENVMVVVDSKRWKGVIYDGVRPSVRAPALALLFEERSLQESFAVHVSKANRSGTRLDVRYHLDSESPAVQTRIQARRLHGLLASTATKNFPLVRTCVFYSHPESHVVTSGVDRSEGVATVIADPDNVAGVLMKLHNAHPGEVSSDQRGLAIKTVRELGADLVGTGKFAKEYESPVPLSTRIRGRSKGRQYPKSTAAR